MTAQYVSCAHFRARGTKVLGHENSGENLVAHNVESMMYAGVAPWHGIGVPVATELRSDEALRLAGLDWSVRTAPVFAGQDHSVVERWRAVVRESDAKPLGLVGDRYEPIQNADAFRFFDEVVGAGEAIYHTAGSLDGGRRVWILAKLPGEVRVGRDDVTEKFLLLTNSHDGSTTLRMLFTPVRVVCQNTLNVALQEGAGDGIAIRHTRTAMTRLEQARHALGLATKFYDQFAEASEMLVRSSYSDAQVLQLTQTLFPDGDEGVSPRMQKARDKVIELFECGRGHEAIRGTAWAALNAVAEYVDHHQPTRGVDDASRASGRLASVWFGNRAAMKQRAYEVIRLQVAA